jgi:hypothetical protein
MEQRVAAWREDKPRQRRDAPWEPGTPRQRRRPRWGEFREAYPRIVAGLAVGVAILLALDGWLLFQRLRYQGQIRSYRRAMNTLDRQRADAVVAAGQSRAALTLELVRRQAVGDRTLNLAVSLDDGVMRLQREGAILREMKAEIGPEAVLGEPPDQVRLAAPLGKRAVLRVLRAGYRWEVPAWVYAQRRLSLPADRLVPDALGPVAVILSGGTVLYSRPEGGPLADDAFVLPGSVRVGRDDLRAVADNLADGTPVYFH